MDGPAVTEDLRGETGEAPTRVELRRRGADVLSRLGHGTTPPRARPLYLTSVEGMQHYTTDALWGSVWSRPGLTMRLRVLVTLSILASIQRLPQLRTYLNSALNLGLDASEVQEVLIQCSVFAGFPATVNAMELFREVLDSRATTVVGRQIPEVELEELDAQGWSLHTHLFGAGAADRSPPDSGGGAGDGFETLTAVERRFVYGELLGRPGLDLAARAMCALASVIAFGARTSSGPGRKAASGWGSSRHRSKRSFFSRRITRDFPPPGRPGTPSRRSSTRIRISPSTEACRRSGLPSVTDGF